MKKRTREEMASQIRSLQSTLKYHKLKVKKLNKEVDNYEDIRMKLNDIIDSQEIVYKRLRKKYEECKELYKKTLRYKLRKLFNK